jgi:hypothetical protein
MEEGAKTPLRRIFAGDGDDEDEEEEDEEEDEENGDGDRRRSDPSGAGGPHSVIQQRGKRGSSTVDEREKAGPTCNASSTRIWLVSRRCGESSVMPSTPVAS